MNDEVHALVRACGGLRRSLKKTRGKAAACGTFREQILSKS